MTLIEELPRADPATRADLDAVGQRLGGRIGGLEHRMDALEHHMDGLEHRMDGLEQRMDGLEQRVKNTEEHVIRLDERLQTVKFEVIGALHEGLGSLRSELVTQSRTLFFAMVATMATFAAVVVAAIRLP